MLRGIYLLVNFRLQKCERKTKESFHTQCCNVSEHSASYMFLVEVLGCQAGWSYSTSVDPPRQLEHPQESAVVSDTLHRISQLPSLC